MVTITCPNCHTLITTPEAHAACCEQCEHGDVALYLLHIGGKTLTLCLDCIQGRLNATAYRAGPSETKAKDV